MGVGGAMMWPAILGMTYALLPSEQSGPGGRLDLWVRPVSATRSAPLSEAS